MGSPFDDMAWEGIGWQRALSARYRRLGRLLRLHIDLTFDCPLACSHCYLQGHADKGPELETETWKQVLREAAQSRVLFLLISGGDPMLRPDFWDLVEAARTLHFNVRIKTTGILLEAEDALRLARLGNVSVDVSLHGARPETHDRFVGRPGAFATTIQAIHILRASNIPVAISMSVVADNIGEAQDLIAMGKNLGARVRTSGILTHQSDGQYPNVVPASIEAQAQLTANVTPMLENAPTKTSPDDPLCLAGHDGLYIGPTGDVSPCVAWPRILGNVRLQSLKDIFTSHEAEVIRALRQRDRTRCFGCNLLLDCSFCPGEAELSCQDCLAPPRSSCDQALVMQRTRQIRLERSGHTHG